MNPATGRSSIYVVAGGYLIYLAYGLLKNLIDQEPTTMPLFLQILFIILFTGIGITLLVFAWKTWKKGRENSDTNPDDPEETDDTATSEKKAGEN